MTRQEPEGRISEQETSGGHWVGSRSYSGIATKSLQIAKPFSVDNLTSIRNRLSTHFHYAHTKGRRNGLKPLGFYNRPNRRARLLALAAAVDYDRQRGAGFPTCHRQAHRQAAGKTD